MPKVSVIIPNYNHAAFLEQRIESVLNQSYQDFEIIILDDFSKDNSKEVIENYRNHPKVSKIIYNQQNSGSTFKQWEKGIMLATGEYIWIAESDDWCEYTLLEELIHPLVINQNCVISYCQSYCIQNDNQISWQSNHSFLAELLNGRTFIKKYMLKNNTIFNSSMVLWKKEAYAHVSKEFVNYKFCGDWLFWIELAKLGDVHISGRLLNYFRKHDKDVSGKATKNGLHLTEGLKLLNTLFKDSVIDDTEYKKVFKQHFKNYWRQKNIFSPNVSKEIKWLLKNPASSKVSYYKVLLSAIWNQSRDL